MRKTFLFTLFCALSFISFAQESNPVPASTAEDRWAAFEQRKVVNSESMLGELRFENIGPTVFSGRVTDIEVNPADPTHFYVAYASGGLWYTNNNGTSFTPIFDNEAVMTIGDIAVDWNTNSILVGTGENNSSRSSYAGLGMFKSTDQGESWQYIGLPESHHISRIIIHPEDPRVIHVAVLGSLYSPNPERGVYKSTDGGENWTKTLFVNNNAGAADLLIDPDDPDVLYAAIWERTRRAWNFVESGGGSGIYRSDDGGETWELLTDEKSGFPTGDGVGRIGLAIAGKKIYALLDNYFRREKDPDEEPEGLTRDDLRTMSKTEFAELDNQDLADYLKDNRFPEEYDAERIKQMVADDEIVPATLVEYLENANALLFDTDVIGAEVYVSDNSGKSWKRTHEGFIDRLYNTYGYYFGQIRVSPHDDQKLYILGVPVLRSDDGGSTWQSINGDNVHADHHALWVSPDRPGHLILGNDGGINISYDDGSTWNKCNSPSVGQFYSVHIDRASPYRVYGGLQDNGVWGGDHNYRPGTRWHSTGNYHYDSYLGGDGMQVQVDFRDNNTLYTGFQFGNYYRIDMTSRESKYITPKHDLTERPFRWNWQTPIHLSRHQQDILYMGSNMLHRSFDQGDNFEIISPDLTRGGIKGDVPFGTLTTIHESPLKFGLIYTGSDDGRVHVTQDFGNSWTEITNGLPADMYVSCLVASSHEESRVYCTLNGYRWDNFEAWVFVSNDYGQSWTSISGAVPGEPVNVIFEDPDNEQLLYVGTDNGLYISLDGGNSFHGVSNQIPAVAIHDIDMHPEDGDLVLGTHGRSFYRSYVRPVQEMSDLLADNNTLTALQPEQATIRRSSRWGNKYADWAEANTPEFSFPVYAPSSGSVRWVVLKDDLEVASGQLECVRGLNYLDYDLSVNESNISAYQQSFEDMEDSTPEVSDNGTLYLSSGKYKVRFSEGDSTSESSFEVK